MTDYDPIAEIKQNLSVERMVRRRASDWRDESGGDRVGRCTHPIHGHTSSNSDGTPNMIVTEDGGWYCYSHGTGGGVFEWVAVEEGICSCGNLPLSDDEFKQALREAADRADVSLQPVDVDYEDLSEQRRARFALDTAVDIMHDNLDTVIDGMTIRKRLKEIRGFDDETIDQARIGYINDQAHAKLLEELSSEALQDIGLHRDNQSLHVRERIVYPYLEGGLPTYWIARATDESPIDAKYMKPHSETCVLDQPIYVSYPPQGTQNNNIWVAEGIQDAISLSAAGGVTAISAVATNPSPHQMEQLVERATEADKTIVCFDSDEAGVKKATDLAVELMRSGVQTDISFVPEGDDPNDFFVDGGSFDDLETKSGVQQIIEQHGDSEQVIHRILSTVEPNTIRADRVVEEINSQTPYQKRTLRGLIRDKYQYEQQQGWLEPVRLEKTTGAETEWTLIYPDGTEIHLEEITGWGAARTFCEKYAAKFNYAPNLDEDEWIDYINGWMSEVGVTEVNPLSKEGRVREVVLETFQEQDVASDWREVPSTPHLQMGYGDDDVIYVMSDALEEWIDDMEVSLREAREYLDPIMAGDTTRKTVDYKRYRMWPFSVEKVKDEGYPAPEPVESPDEPAEPEDAEVEEL